MGDGDVPKGRVSRRSVEPAWTTALAENVKALWATTSVRNATAFDRCVDRA
jgi:hypothetical protein